MRSASSVRACRESCHGHASRSSSCSSLLASRSSGLRCRSRASTQTGRPSAARPARRGRPEAGARQQAGKVVVAEAEPAVAQLLVHPRLVVGAQVENQQPAARLRTRTASASACAGSAAWCSACDSSATSIVPIVKRQLFESPFFHVTFVSRLRARAPWRARAPPASDRWRRRAAPSAPFRRSGSPRRSRGRRRRAAAAAWPSARDHAAQLRPGTSCRPSRVSGLTCFEVLAPQPQHFLQPGSSALTGGGRAPRRTAPAAAARAALAVVANAGRQAVVGERAVALLDDQAGVLQQAEVPRDAGLRQPENAGQLLDVEAVQASTRSSRSRASSPSSR